MQKQIAILGSTGSIGTQALEVINNNSNLFNVDLLIAGNNWQLLAKQAIEFLPKVVVIGNEKHKEELKAALSAYDIEQVCRPTINVLLTAVVGFAGLVPTVAAIKAKKTIALANKETLVVAGEIITQLCKEHQVALYPVDSEHSAIFQCLVGEKQPEIEKIILTASGGPFRGKNIDFLRNVKKEQALKHPNWEMGAKITIDSASLMNKGLEVIEAKWLFGLNNEQIDVIVHPESIIHSMVQFIDGSIKAQMGLPDMKLPIQYALGYPERIENDFPRFNFAAYPQLNFEKPDSITFKCLALAFQAMQLSGIYPCVL
ncbi:UNVERIFIED_CONTAM: hypothetical protein GTU68_032896, partial [Idotea baltica]|nr:hypothetical protein [Idotea baltica]